MFVLGDKALIAIQLTEVQEEAAALEQVVTPRPYALEGDTAQACVAYTDFLSLWNDADPTSESSSARMPSTRTSFQGNLEE